MERIQPPREVVKDEKLRRETCGADFQSNIFVVKILGRPSEKYVHFGYKSVFEYGDLTVKGKQVEDGVSEAIRTFPKFNKIPVLGTVVVQVSEDGENHMLAYLLQPTDDKPKLWIFETYNTSRAFFGRSVDWAEALAKYLGASSHEFAIPRGINLQEFEDPEKGRCVMWSLIFLDYLKKMDLRTATDEDFQAMYRDIAAKNKTKDGFLELQSIVYGASRKTLKRKHRKVKTRRHGSSLRASRTYKKRAH